MGCSRQEGDKEKCGQFEEWNFLITFLFQSSSCKCSRCIVRSPSIELLSKHLEKHLNPPPSLIGSLDILFSSEVRDNASSILFQGKYLLDVWCSRDEKIKTVIQMKRIFLRLLSLNAHWQRICSSHQEYSKNYICSINLIAEKTTYRRVQIHKPDLSARHLHRKWRPLCPSSS